MDMSCCLKMDLKGILFIYFFGVGELKLHSIVKFYKHGDEILDSIKSQGIFIQCSFLLLKKNFEIPRMLMDYFLSVHSLRVIFKLQPLFFLSR
jgi:hypothetical protein